jgi:hypothetical protein
VNILEVQKAIPEFHAANGRFPADLTELSGFSGIALKNDNCEYDLATGTLKEKQLDAMPSGLHMTALA